MLVLIDFDRAGLPAWNVHGHDFLSEIAAFDRLARTLLRAPGEGILILARDLEFLGDVLAGLRH